MQNLYINIIETINANKQRFIDLGLAPIRTIDIYNGQVEAVEDFDRALDPIIMDIKDFAKN